MFIKEHNKEAYRRIKEGFKSKKQVATICATGTGKSYQALQLIEDNIDKNILYITSLKTIKEQFELLCKTELSHEVSAIVFDSINSKIMSEKWDYIIIDEFHRGGAEVWGKKLRLLLDHNPDAKLLGLSATPIRYLDNMRNMADELFDGNVVYELSLANAIAQGILPIPQYISCLYSFDDVNSRISRYEERLKTEKRIKERGKVNKLIEKAKTLIAASPDVKTILNNNIIDREGHYIIFCSDIDQLNNLSLRVKDLFKEINDVSIYSIHSHKRNNNNTLLKFLNDDSSKLKVLLAVNMITEGIHAEHISGVIFLRPTASPNVYLQQMGRALSSGKKTRPLIIDMVNNTDCLKLSKDLADEVNKIIIQSYETIREDMRFTIIDYVKQIEELLSEVESSLYWGWNDWYELAKKYYVEHGDLAVPKNYKNEEGYNIDSWLKSQRKEYRKGTLSNKQIELLDRIEMRWNPLQELWDEGYSHAQEYYMAHGDLSTSSDYISEDGFSLGIWIQNERVSYKKGSLSQENIAKLEQIGMIWNVPDERWNSTFLLAKEYYEQHGDLMVPRQYVTESGVKLGMWITDRRRNYKNNTLTLEQITRLESIGMVWSVNADTLNKGLQEARDFYGHHNDLIVPRNYISDSGFKLGSWISHMRENYRKKKLDQSTIDELNRIEMVWDRQNIRTRRKRIDEDKESCNPYEVENNTYIEGATKQVVVNAYERDKKARKKCIDYYHKKDGTVKCQICGFDFGVFYGKSCRNLIEVHHIKPLSTIGEEYLLDPIADLLPICPNCHYVVHARFDGDIEKLINILNSMHDNL